MREKNPLSVWEPLGERGLLQLQGEARCKENTVVTNLYIIIKLL